MHGSIWYFYPQRRIIAKKEIAYGNTPLLERTDTAVARFGAR